MRITKGIYDVWAIKLDADTPYKAVDKLKKEGFKHNQITIDREYGYWIVTGKRKIHVRRTQRLI